MKKFQHLILMFQKIQQQVSLEGKSIPWEYSETRVFNMEGVDLDFVQWSAFSRCSFGPNPEHYLLASKTNDLNLGIQCKHFRDQDILTDVTLVIGNQEFRSHRLVLATNIPYFNKMFCSGMIEASKGRVKIAKKLNDS